MSAVLPLQLGSSCWPVATEVLVWFQTSTHGICGGQNWTGTCSAI